VNLRILAAAELEIIEARQHLDEKLSGLGGRFLDDLAETLSAIVEEPLRFPKLETLPHDQPFRRARLAIFRYAIVFEILTRIICTSLKR
jgi:hypothetical protein